MRDQISLMVFISRPEMTLHTVKRQPADIYVKLIYLQGYVDFVDEANANAEGLISVNSKGQIYMGLVLLL